MNNTIAFNEFSLLDQSGSLLCLHHLGQLGAAEAAAIRETIYYQVRNGHQKVYLDARGVKKADLSGINEIIQAQHSLRRYDKNLVLVFEQDSVLDQWIVRLGLEDYIETAIVPALRA